MPTLAECDAHHDKMMEIVQDFDTIAASEKESKRAEARAHFEAYNKCMDELKMPFRKEFNPRFLLPLLYPEQQNAYEKGMAEAIALGLGSGAGEEEPNTGGARRKSRKHKHRKLRKSRRQTKRR